MTTSRRASLAVAVAAAVLAATALPTACTNDDEPGTGGIVLEPTGAVDGDTVAATALEAALADIVAETGVPALGVALFDQDGPIEVAASGVRRRGNPTEVTVDDAFHLGSNTKAMTAVLLARLDEQGLGIGFDTTLAEAFPSMARVHDGYAGVTMAQLLTHTGGAPGDELEIDDTILSMPVVEGRAVGTELVLSEPPAVEPGRAVAYSNAGYVIAAAAMEHVTGESWEQLMIDHVFTPLDMRSCGFGPPGTEGTADQPMGHDGNGDAVYWDNPPLLGPAGGVHCSMEDWGRFLVELLNGHRGSSEYLTAASVEAVFRPAPVAIDDNGVRSASGWLVIDGLDSPDGPGYYHNGSNTAWFSQALILPETGRVVLAVTNEETTGEEAAGRAFAVLSERSSGS